MSYSDVSITNSTPYPISGVVHYASVFCSNDHFSIDPGATWTHSRGVCLITEIDATVYPPSGTVQASPYESDGTTYSQFVVAASPGIGNYVVSRITSGAEDVPPADYYEPTEKAK